MAVIFCLLPVKQTAVHEEQAAVCIYTVYCVFILCTVSSAQEHRVCLDNTVIRYFPVFGDILIVKSLFNNPESDYGVF